MKRGLRRFIIAVCACFPLLLSGCSAFTSIDRDANGDYVITGWQAPGPVGFVWICSYDPATKTLTIKEER